jgi:uncharacterized protein
MRAAILDMKATSGPTIMLHSGATLDFLNPRASDFTLDDIAHGLSNICRYAGQCDRFYSVAEHSILVSEVTETFKLEALMHDAAEAFLGDVTRPLKQVVPEFKVLERNIQQAINERFGLSDITLAEIKTADLSVLAAEQAQIMPAGLSDWAVGAGITPAAIRVSYLQPTEAKTRFLTRYHQLNRERA